MQIARNFVVRIALTASFCSAIVVGQSAGGGAAAIRHDLVVRGGTYYLGPDEPARVLHLVVDGERIVTLAEELDASIRGTREIDASGLVVAPGFIDVHAHADRSAARRGEARNFVTMGVTTLVTGNCGGSEPDLAKHFAQVERNGISVNYASLIGHGTVRRAAMGTANRSPTNNELTAMRKHVRRAMREGAFGMSTGLIYVPGTYADTDELVALCEVVAESGGVYASHMRNEGRRVLESIDEALEIGRRSGVHVHLSHLKAAGKPNWGKSEQIVERMRAARADGIGVTGDQYAYCASSTGLEVLFPSAPLAVGRGAFCKQLGTDDELRSEMLAALRRTAKSAGFDDFHYAQIAFAPGHPEFSGLRIDAVAKRLVDGDDLDAQCRAIVQLMIDSKGRRVQMCYHKMCEPDLERILREPYVSVAADAGIRMYDTEEKPHPRGAGNNPRVLGRYVRERGTIPLGLAIDKMTRLPAEVFGLEDRGVIRVGAFADLTLFDPDTVADGATYEDPLAPPTGIRYVIVNGTVVVRDGEHTKARPGHVLRASRRPATK